MPVGVVFILRFLQSVCCVLFKTRYFNQIQNALTFFLKVKTKNIIPEVNVSFNNCTLNLSKVRSLTRRRFICG